MSDNMLTNEEKAALAAEVAGMVTARTQDNHEQQQVIRMTIILLLGNCARLTFE